MRITRFVKVLTTHNRKSSPKTPLSAWEKSARLAGTIVNPGPDVSRLKAEEVVTALREQAVVAESHIRKITGLEPSAAHKAAYGDVLAQVCVVDRAHWSVRAARSMADLFRVDEATPIDGVPDPTDLNGPVETTAALTFLAQKTLGQFIPNFSKSLTPVSSSMEPRTSEPRTSEAQTGETPQNQTQREQAPQAPESPGELLLVAPNVLMHQRAMAVDLNQFALWICMHEYTHALQFAAADWLPRYMQERIDTVVRSFDSESSLLAWARALAESMRGRDSMMDRLLNDAQREELSRITALMSVLEGHADVVMDLVPVHLLPTRRTLRRKFNARRKEASKLTSAVGRVSGLSAKTAQYQNGAEFVRAARTKVGADGFNRVFLAPEFLPTTAELDDVDSWAARTDALLEARAAAEALVDSGVELDAVDAENAVENPTL